MLVRKPELTVAATLSSIAPSHIAISPPSDRPAQPIRLAWYADIMATFKEFDIAWANWDYKGSFGIVTPDGKETGLVEVLLS